MSDSRLDLGLEHLLVDLLGPSLGYIGQHLLELLLLGFLHKAQFLEVIHVRVFVFVLRDVDAVVDHPGSFWVPLSAEGDALDTLVLV